MNDSLIVFDDLVRCVIEKEAVEEDFELLDEMMSDDPGLQDRYCRQMYVHALLTCQKGQAWPEAGDQRSEAGGRKFWDWWKVAAAAAVLLGGIAVWRSFSPISDFRPLTSDLRSPIADLRPPTSVSPVTLVNQSGVRGLDLPDALPGTVRLSAGEAVVRLGSGVRLTVLGPASLEVNNAMEVTLEKGRLLADVPHWATGFMVRTAALEVYDLGTVFSVSVDWPVSDVFVFKGRVRVNETGHGEIGNAASGEVVGICEAGEGVRAEAGERPVKFAADWPAAKKAFASVRDNAAAENPAAAFVFVEKIADLWTDAYLSRELSRVESRRSATASAPKIPFRKTAWVRPAASAQQETSDMKTTSAAAMLAAVTMMGAGAAGAVSEPMTVNTSPVANRYWETVYTNEVTVSWRWAATNAVSAELSVSGMGGEVLVTNVTRAVSNVLWRAFASVSPEAEDVYDLRLTFYNGSEAVVGVQTSRLAVVKSAFGKASVDPGLNDKTWDTVKDNVVIPYDAGWAAATDGAAGGRLVIAKSGGETQTNTLADAGGYFGWKIRKSGWGYGTFNLALTFPGTVTNAWDATLARPMDGTMIRMQ
jgi:hypothetical protein